MKNLEGYLEYVEGLKQRVNSLLNIIKNIEDYNKIYNLDNFNKIKNELNNFMIDLQENYMDLFNNSRSNKGIPRPIEIRYIPRICESHRSSLLYILAQTKKIYELDYNIEHSKEKQYIIIRNKLKIIQYLKNVKTDINNNKYIIFAKILLSQHIYSDYDLKDIEEISSKLAYIEMTKGIKMIKKFMKSVNYEEYNKTLNNQMYNIRNLGRG